MGRDKFTWDAGEIELVPSATDWRKEDLTPAELLWIGTMLQRLRELRGFSRGIFADFLVAAALPGATPSSGGTDRFDLTWRDLRVEVKSRGPRSRCWTVRPAFGRDESGKRVCRLWADIYVLAHHSGTDHRTGWSFYVVPRSKLPRQPKPGTKITIDDSKLASWTVEKVGVEDLPRAVRAAGRHS